MGVGATLCGRPKSGNKRKVEIEKCGKLEMRKSDDVLTTNNQLNLFFHQRRSLSSIFSSVGFC